jgi:hypothetical protein
MHLQEFNIYCILDHMEMQLCMQIRDFDVSCNVWYEVRTGHITVLHVQLTRWGSAGQDVAFEALLEFPHDPWDFQGEALRTKPSNTFQIPYDILSSAIISALVEHMSNQQ